jgi:hypothetical protein
MGSATCRQGGFIRDLQGGEREKEQRRKDGEKDYGARSPYPRLPISSWELHDYVTPVYGSYGRLWVERGDHQASYRTKRMSLRCK